MSLFVYFGLLALAFVLLYPLLVHTPSEYGTPLPLADLNLALWIAMVGSALFVVLALGYSLGTYLWSKRKRDPDQPPGHRIGHRHPSPGSPRPRQTGQRPRPAARAP